MVKQYAFHMKRAVVRARSDATRCALAPAPARERARLLLDLETRVSIGVD